MADYGQRGNCQKYRIVQQIENVPRTEIIQEAY